MKLLDELRAEHDLIDRVLGSLRTYVALRIEGESDTADAPMFVAFFRYYASGFHHAREEAVLFPALVRDAELPSRSGPIAALIAQHHTIAATLDELEPLLCGRLDDADARRRLVDAVTRYTRSLWSHIDAENSVLLPEAANRLRRVNVHELPGRAATAEELAAAEAGARLAQRYAAAVDPGALRGEGCVVCPSFGAGCDGVEREWWNEFEWEEFPDHL